MVDLRNAGRSEWRTFGMVDLNHSGWSAAYFIFDCHSLVAVPFNGNDECTKKVHISTEPAGTDCTKIG